MKHLKNYIQLITEAILTDIDELLNSINDKKCDFYSLKLSNDDYINRPIDEIYNDSNFNKQLFKLNLKKGELESTIDIENFLKKNIDMTFFFLYSRNETILDNPNYLILQYDKNDRMQPIEIYKTKGSVNNFYEKLTAKEIKLVENDVIYIYQTSNSGNNWQLKDKSKKNFKFKEFLETNEIKELVQNNVKLTIIK